MNGDPGGWTNISPLTISDRSVAAASNNFDLLRIFAALLVIASHSYPLSGHNDREIFYSLLNYDTGGGYGVAIFFVISGFLVTRSALQRPLVSYLTSRFMRIVPGLAVALVFEAFVIGPLCTRMNLATYFSAPQTWRFLHGVTIFQLGGSLPGVFETLPAPNTNGSLWTIPVEVFFYLLLPIMVLPRLLPRRGVLIVLAASALGFWYLKERLGLSWNQQGGDIVAAVPLYSTVRMALFFLFGAAGQIWRDRVPLDPGLAGIAVVLLWIGQNAQAADLIYYPCFGYLVMFLALYRKVHVPFYDRIGDISYGTYLYAFPVQQVVVQLFGARISPTVLTLLATPVVLLLATASWRWVERPVLSWRRAPRPISSDIMPRARFVEPQVPPRS